jgi:hypothetical protein
MYEPEGSPRALRPLPCARTGLDGPPARHEFAGPSQPVRAVPTAFTDALVITGPTGYQRRPDEAADPPPPRRTLHFGPHDEGHVTFPIYPHDDLVPVARIQ